MNGENGMKTAVVQMEVTYRRKGENYRRAAMLVGEASSAGADTVVLPELWDGGFVSDDPRSYSDRDGMETKAFLSSLALRNGINIVGGSVITEKSGKLYNTCYVFTKDGHLEAEYDKNILFPSPGEGEYLESGDASGVFLLGGIRCAVLLSCDALSPSSAWEMAEKGASVIFIPAFFSSENRENMRLVSRCRALENGVCTVLCSALGKTPGLSGAGYSAVYGPDGEELSSLGDDEAFSVLTLDRNELSSRRGNPLL